VEDSSSAENHKTDYSAAAEIKFPPKNESDMQCADAIADAKSPPLLVHHDDADISKEKVSEPVEDFLSPKTRSLDVNSSTGGDDGRPVAPVRKTRRRSKESNESCHTEPTNSSHETEARRHFEDKNKTEAWPFEEKIATDLVDESELSNHKPSNEEGIINEAMSKEVEWALAQKREATKAGQSEADLKDSKSHHLDCDNHPNEEKADAIEKSADVLEKERQRKVSEENAKAEKLQLENLMRLVQEKIERARKEKEKRSAENLKE